MSELVDRANATNYGLAAGVLTSDINKALTFVQASETVDRFFLSFPLFMLYSISLRP